MGELIVKTVKNGKIIEKVIQDEEYQLFLEDCIQKVKTGEIETFAIGLIHG